MKRIVKRATLSESQRSSLKDETVVEFSGIDASLKNIFDSELVSIIEKVIVVI